jgi:hypothetical protein
MRHGSSNGGETLTVVDREMPSWVVFLMILEGSVEEGK